VKQSRSELTRENIYQAALRCFRERGFEQATMREVAKEAQVALGAAYYYYASKDALVMDFYQRSQIELHKELTQSLNRGSDFKARLRRVIEAKFLHFAENRALLRALAQHTDPEHPLSPFGKQTADIRERDIAWFRTAVEGSQLRVPKDLEPYLPRLLWLYQMGLILFWVHDRSQNQQRTQALFEKSLGVVVNLVKIATLPPLRPLRKTVLDLVRTAYDEDEA
jgi:AcrR family transcriptional regulator